MTGAERGWLLLCADLADGARPLTPAQVRSLRLQLRQAGTYPVDPGRPLAGSDLRAIGCDDRSSERILSLLDREKTLDSYLRAGADYGIFPLTRSSPSYPSGFLRLGDQAPGVLFYRGDPALLNRRAVCLTGSRNLSGRGCDFARRVGALAAKEHYVLVSGDARGADRTAQEACIQAGGDVISVLPGPLFEHAEPSERQLLLCEEGWHLPFSGYRALYRNRLIYALAEIALVAEIGMQGGTMRGAEEALRSDLTPVFVQRDSGEGYHKLIELGADPVDPDFPSLQALRPTRIPMPLSQTARNDSADCGSLCRFTENPGN